MEGEHESLTVGEEMIVVAAAPAAEVDEVPQQNLPVGFPALEQDAETAAHLGFRHRHLVAVVWESSHSTGCNFHAQ